MPIFFIHYFHNIHPCLPPEIARYVSVKHRKVSLKSDFDMKTINTIISDKDGIGNLSYEVTSINLHPSHTLINVSL